MKSPTQQAIIFLLEEYLRKLDPDRLSCTPREEKARELLKALKGGE